MSLSVRDASGLSEIGEVWVRDGSGLSQIAEVWVRDPSGLSQVFGAFSLSASPQWAEGSVNSKASLRVSTNSVTVAPKPSGSVSSVSWLVDTDGWDVLNPTSLTTAFRSPPIDPGDSQTATATCTVTRGSQSAFVSIPLIASNFGFI